MTSERAGREAPRSWKAQAVIVAAAGIVTALAAVELLGNAWAACDLGVANWPGLYLIELPRVTLVAAAWWALVVLGVGRAGIGAGGELLAVILLGASGSAGIVWALLAWKHNPGGDYPAPICSPDNIPPWWPSWVPL